MDINRPQSNPYHATINNSAFIFSSKTETGFSILSYTFNRVLRFTVFYKKNIKNWQSILK